MKLKAILDTLDGLDEALKGFYTEKDGKFILNVEGFDPNEAEVLRNTMRRAKDEKKAAEKELNDLKERFAGLPDDFSVDDYNASLDKGGGNIDQRLSEQKDRLTTQFNTKMAESTAKLEAANKRANSLHSENALMTALTEANVAKPMINAVKSMFKDQIKVEYEGDEAIVTIDSLPVMDKIKAWAGTEEGKYFVAAAGNGGGGSGVGGSGSHTDYSKMNDTQLIMIQDKDPRAKAEMEKRTLIEKPKY